MKTQTEATARPWHLTQGTNGFCKTWQVGFVSTERAQTIADCGAIENQVYQGDTSHFIGTKINENHQANAALIVQAVNQFDALNAVAEESQRSIKILETMLTWEDLPTLVKQKINFLIKHNSEALSALETLRNNH